MRSPEFLSPHLHTFQSLLETQAPEEDLMIWLRGLFSFFPHILLLWAGVRLVSVKAGNMAGVVTKSSFNYTVMAPHQIVMKENSSTDTIKTVFMDHQM